MIIIADAGSTKIDWVLLDDRRQPALHLETSGHNAAVCAPGTLTSLLREEAPQLVAEASRIEEIHYYGAGCAGDRCPKVAAELAEVFPTAICHVESDMLASARALCGHRPGIACILGTGSNSCLYDGERIVASVSPLGFILGDEGSGAVLGRRFLGMLFKGQFPANIRTLFSEAYPDLTAADIIERVYRRERPNAYLASFAPFLSRHIDLPEIDSFITDEFERFFRFNILAYDNATKLPVNFTGSIALHFSPQLRRAAARCGLTVGHIEKSPMTTLIHYHSACVNH